MNRKEKLIYQAVKNITHHFHPISLFSTFSTSRYLASPQVRDIPAQLLSCASSANLPTVLLMLSERRSEDRGLVL